MKKKILISATISLFLFAIGFWNIAIAKSIKITPATTKVKIGGTKKFKVRIKGSYNWYVNDVLGGNDSVGTITQENPAIYTPPSTPPNPDIAIIKAVSVADPSEFVTAKVKIKFPSSTTTTAKSIKMTSVTTKVKIGGTKKFKVSIKGSYNWYVNDVLGGNDSVGTITQENPAIYTPPSTPPNPDIVIIKAVSVADPTKFWTSEVKIELSSLTTTTTPLTTTTTTTTPLTTTTTTTTPLTTTTTQTTTSTTTTTIIISNLLSNPGFESGTDPWVFYSNGAAEFSNAFPGSSGFQAAKISISQPGSNTQLYQKDIVLQSGTRYLLSFDAYSNTGHNLSVVIHKHDSPYTNYGLSNYVADLTTSWKNFSVEFDASGFSGTTNDVRLRFWLADSGASGDEFWIDNVTLTRVEPQ